MEQLDKFSRYLTFEKRYSEHTVGAYITDIQQFTAFYLEYHNSLDSFEAISFSDVRKWVIHLMRSDVSERSVHRKLSSIRTLFKFLRSIGAVSHNPCLKVQIPKFSATEPDILTVEEFKRCFDCYFDTVEPGVDKDQDILIIALLITTGIRVSELIKLKSSQIRSNDNFFEIKVLGKGKKERIIPIQKELFDSLQEFINLKKENAKENLDGMFHSKGGKPIYERYVQRLVAKVLAPTQKIQQKSPHALRHAFATNLLNEGAELVVIRSLLGHSNLAATQVYTNSNFERLLAVYRQSFPKA